jgi:hypothetical protein
MLVDELKLFISGDGPQVCGHHGLGFVTDLTDTAKEERLKEKICKRCASLQMD